MSVAKRAHVYPQVDPGAAGVVNVAVARAPAGARVAEALRIARARNAAAVTSGDGEWILREDLARGARLGLDDVPAADLARPLPVVDGRDPEVKVRRLLAAGAPLVSVRHGREWAGAVLRPAGDERPGPALGPRFAQRLAESTREALVAVARLAVTRGARVFLAGGTVRDALRDGDGAVNPAQGRDVDLVVEGDGLGLARALAGILALPAGALVEHGRFLTAALAVPGGRIDVATARSERYETQGALPRVLPATIAQDLARRDFTINAMAVELASGGYGLLDPFGGRGDLARRRLRVLHPLSFVEDPTRIFRAARYAARLGFAFDHWTARAQALALRLAPYPALSGPRLSAELELIVNDAAPEAALRRLARAGAFRLLDGRYRFTPATGRRIDALGAAWGWARSHALGVTVLELGLLTILGDQPPDVARHALERLGMTGEPLARIRRALEGGPALAARLTASGRPSERARPLWGRADVELTWLWLIGGPPARAALEWFVSQARGVRPVLDGDAIVALGVPRGRDVARLLGELRDGRLDEGLKDRDAEAAYVRDWIDRSLTATEKGGMGWRRNSSS